MHRPPTTLTDAARTNGADGSYLIVEFWGCGRPQDPDNRPDVEMKDVDAARREDLPHASFHSGEFGDCVGNVDVMRHWRSLR